MCLRDSMRRLTHPRTRPALIGSHRTAAAAASRWRALAPLLFLLALPLWPGLSFAAETGSAHVDLAAPGWLERNRELVLVLVGLLSAAVILVLVWNRSLRRMVLLRVRDLRASERRLHFALSAARMVAWRWDISADTLNWAESPASLIGPEPAVGYPDFRELVHPKDRAAFLLAGRQAIAQGAHYRIEFRITRTDGVVRWVEARGMPSANDTAGPVSHLDGVSQDITERKETEAKIDRLSKLYAALNQCNQAIVHSRSEEELFPQICRAAVDFGDLKMAWVGQLDETGTCLKPVAAYGEHTEYVQDLRITTTADDPSGRGPTGVAVRENRPVWCQDFLNDPMTAPWHERGARFGWHASASLPLCRDDAVIGAFSVYSGEVYAFDETVRESLIEMAADISFVLGNFERERRRTRAEAALMESQQKLQIILDTALDAVIRMDTDGIIVGWNAQAEKIFGWPRSEALGRALHETIIPPESRAAHLRGLRHFLASGNGPVLNRRVEIQAAHRDGQLFPVELAITPVRTEGRYEFSAFINDITQRKQAQVALTEAKQRLEIALEGSQISVWEIDLRTNKIWLDADWAVFLGLPRAETRTAISALHALVHPDDQRKAAAAAVDTMKGKFASYAVEHRVKCANGEWKWILSRGRVIERDAGGQALRMSGTNTDITESKRDDLLLELEHAVVRCLALEKDAPSALQAVMRTICESMNWVRSTYWRADEAAGLMRFGHSWEVSGLGLERYAERSRSMVFAPGTGLVGRVWQTGEPLWVPDFGNDPRVVQQALARETGIHCVFVFPVTSEGRTIGALAFFSREVREPEERLLALTRVIGGELGQFLQRKQAEDQVRTLNAELEARVAQRTQQLETANKELEAFSYSVSHDLRAPLRAIQGFSRLVEQQYAGRIDDAGRDMLRRVGAGAEKMGLLIDDLLRLARISRQEMKIGRVDLSALAQEAADELRGAEPERRVQWTIAPQVSVEGDPGLLRVVLQNLLGNAWKYSSRRELARIEFGVGEKDGHPAYFVRDNGAGFDMAYSGKLFGAFQRLHSAAEFPGTGIGLATVARIIHRHGGAAWAEGREGEGATFYFSLGSDPARLDRQNPI